MKKMDRKSERAATIYGFIVHTAYYCLACLEYDQCMGNASINYISLLLLMIMVLAIVMAQTRKASSLKKKKTPTYIQV